MYEGPYYDCKKCGHNNRGIDTRCLKCGHAEAPAPPPVSPSIFKRLVIFFSRREKKKTTYFIDWQIYDKQGNFFKWANSVVTTADSPQKVYNDCMGQILKDLNGTGASQARAVAFNKI